MTGDAIRGPTYTSLEPTLGILSLNPCTMAHSSGTPVRRSVYFAELKARGANCLFCPYLALSTLAQIEEYMYTSPLSMVGCLSGNSILLARTAPIGGQWRFVKAVRISIGRWTRCSYIRIPRYTPVLIQEPITLTTNRGRWASGVEVHNRLYLLIRVHMLLNVPSTSFSRSKSKFNLTVSEHRLSSVAPISDQWLEPVAKI